MKKIIAISAAALLGTSVLAVPAMAQISLGVDGGVGVTVDGNDGSVGADVDAGANVGAGSDGVQLGADTDAGVNVETGDSDIQLGADTDAELDADTTAAIGGSFDGAMSAMTRGSDAAASINSMTAISTVNVVHMDELDGANADAFASAETENSAGIDELRAAVEANAAVKAALDAQSISSDQIVAADVNADGSLTVFVR